jgi:hypothetical protein
MKPIRLPASTWPIGGILIAILLAMSSGWVIQAFVEHDAELRHQGAAEAAEQHKRVDEAYERAATDGQPFDMQKVLREYHRPEPKMAFPEW